MRATCTIYILCILSFLFVSAKAYTQSDDDFLKVNGTIENSASKATISEAKVNVFFNSKSLTQTKSSAGGGFTIFIEYQKEYEIEVSKVGFDNYKFIFSTKIPTNEIARNKVIDLRVPLDKLQPGATPGNKITAKIVYIPAEKKFNYDPLFAKPATIEKIADDQDKINTAYDALISDAFKLFNNKEYEKAKAGFLKALDIKPNEKLPKTKIEDIDKILAKAEKPVQENEEKDTVPVAVINENKSVNTPSVGKSILLSDYLDLLKEKNKPGNEQEAAELMRKIGNLYREQNNVAKALEYLDRALSMKLKAGDKSGATNILSDIASANYDTGRYETAIDKYEEALKDKQAMNDKEGAAEILSNLGVVYDNIFRYDRAIDFYNKSLKITEDINDKEGSNKLLTNIGNSYYDKHDLNKSVEYYERALELDVQSGKKENVAASLNNIGVVYYEMGNYEKALEYYEKSLEIIEKAGNKKEISQTYNNMGNLNYDQSKYKNALDFYEKSLRLKEEIDYKNGIALSLHNIANVHRELKENDKAIEYYDRSNKVAGEVNYTEVLCRNYDGLSKVYTTMNNCQKAFDFYKMYANSKFAIIGLGKQKQISEMQNKFDAGKRTDLQEVTALRDELQKQKIVARFEASGKELELALVNSDLIKKDEEVKKQRILTIAFVAGFILILAIAILILRQYRQKQKANRLLAEKNSEINEKNAVLQKQNEEIMAQRDEIEAQRDQATRQRDQIAEQQKEITSSIYYAKRIQNAILPPEDYVTKSLPEHFILFKPLHIVSGDFYWAAVKNKRLIIAVADCTGHGVPGAFMSMLGIAFITEIVNRHTLDPTQDLTTGVNTESNADEILNQLRDHVIKSLHQTGKENDANTGLSAVRDGMDVALCILDLETHKLQYSGANNPLYMVSCNASLTTGKKLENPATGKFLYEVKPDRMPIGIYDSGPGRPFRKQEFNLQKNDTFYLFTDGYADQFGGPDGEKFKYPQFRSLLMELHAKNMIEQKATLVKTLETWQGAIVPGTDRPYNQTDDITVIGIRI